MKTITREKFRKILKLHKKWLSKESDGVRADFTGYDLSGMPFKNENLKYAVLADTTIKYADFTDCCLEGAVLCNAKFLKASFIETNLKSADCEGAEFKRCEFDYSKLEKASFKSAQFEETYIRNCNTTQTDFRKTIFKFSNLKELNPKGADFSETKFESTEYPLGFSSVRIKELIVYDSINDNVISPLSPCPTPLTEFEKKCNEFFKYIPALKDKEKKLKEYNAAIRYLKTISKIEKGRNI